MSRRLTITRASAGAGKTYQLSTRYLRLLVAGEDPGDLVEGILATTFTRKAAGEILGRILLRLAQAVSDADRRQELEDSLEMGPLPQDRCLALLGGFCRALHRVSIGTLDSFFWRLARSYRHELGLHVEGSPRDDRDPLVQELRLEALGRLLVAEGGESFARLLDRFHKDMLPVSVLERLAQPLGTLDALYREAPGAAWGVLRRVSTDAPGEPDAFAAELENRAATAGTQLARAHRNAAASVRAGDWEQFLTKGMGMSLFRAVEGTPPTFGSGANNAVPEDLLRLYQPWVEHARARLLNRLVERLSATRELLERYEAEFRMLRRERRQLLYRDIPDGLAREGMMPDRESLRHRLNAGVRHLLLDEFQDTSPQQWAILRPFAERAADEGGNVYCVGDQKQAIYGWRGGSAAIFGTLEGWLRERWSEDTGTDTLPVSWRSSKVVLDVVNRVFRSLPDLFADKVGAKKTYPERTMAAASWLKGFEDHRAQRDLPGYVTLRTTRPKVASDGPEVPAEESAGDEDSEGALPAEPQPEHEEYVAQQVRAIVEAAPWATVGILTRTNDAARRLIFRLRGIGVSASGEGAATLVDDPAVEVVLAALTLTDHPGDSAAHFQVWHSPLGLVLDLPRESASPATAGVARRIRQQLLVEGYAATLLGWAQALAPWCDARGAERLQQLVELADAQEQDVTLRPSAFVRSVLAARVEQPATGDSPGEGSVRVLTIHSAKGLEFDRVVLPELTGLLDRMEALFLADRPDPTQPIQGIYPRVDEKLWPLHSQFERVHRAEKARQIRESLSVLYVAMTRARHALYMFVPPPAPGDHKFTPAGILRQALLPADYPESPQGEETLFEAGTPDWCRSGDRPARVEAATAGGVEPDFARLLAPSRGGYRGRRTVAPSSMEGAGGVDAARLFRIDNSGGQRLGTAVHAMFERVSWLDAMPSDAELLTAARRAGGPSDANDAGLLATFRRYLDQPEVRTALTRPPDDSGIDLRRELPFAVRVGDEMILGTFDRVVIRRGADGVPLSADVIDFKTDSLPDVDALGRATAVYRPQLAAYRGALSAMLGLPAAEIRASLLFVGPGVRWDLPADRPA